MQKCDLLVWKYRLHFEKRARARAIARCSDILRVSVGTDSLEVVYTDYL